MNKVKKIFLFIAISTILVVSYSNTSASDPAYTVYLPTVNQSDNSCTPPLVTDTTVYYQPQSLWQNVQENQYDAYDWSQAAGFALKLQELRCAGTEPVVVIHDIPEWASWLGGGCSPVRYGNVIDYADFVVALIGQFDLTAVMVMNAPDSAEFVMIGNSAGGCNGNLDLYALLYQVTATKVKNAYPDVRVEVGNPLSQTQDQLEFMRDLYQIIYDNAIYEK